MNKHLKIIAVSGKKRSGKDTVYKLISEYIGQDYVVRVAFADELKQEIADLLGCTAQHIDENKEFFRPFLQWLGTYKRMFVDPNYWVARAYRTMLRAPSKTRVIVVTDLRYINEMEHLLKLGTITIRVSRQSTEDLKDTHSSETELDNAKFNYNVANDSDLEDLKETVIKILKQEQII